MNEKITSLVVEKYITKERGAPLVHNAACSAHGSTYRER